jgi:hypothetical protein
LPEITGDKQAPELDIPAGEDCSAKMADDPIFTRQRAMFGGMISPIRNGQFYDRILLAVKCVFLS